MKLSIIIPTRDRGEIFNQTLQSAVSAVAGLDAEVLVVNDSPTGTPIIPVNLKNVRLLSSEGRGVATARNRGAREASGDLLIFIDDDVVIDATTVRKVIEQHETNDKIALNPDWVYPPELVEVLHHSAFGRFLFRHGMTSFEGWYADKSWKPQEIFESKSVASFHLSLKRKDYEQTGGYDESFPFAGFEDHDFPLRLKKAGISFLIDTRIQVFHNEADRLSMKNWLASQERRAFTRAVAVRKGYEHLALSYSPLKRALHSLLAMGAPLGTVVMSSWPFGKWLDGLAFAGIGYLQAVRIYQGYARGMKS